MWGLMKNINTEMKQTVDLIRKLNKMVKADNLFETLSRYEHHNTKRERRLRKERTLNRWYARQQTKAKKRG